jgi:hypothetical protein
MIDFRSLHVADESSCFSHVGATRVFRRVGAVRAALIPDEVRRFILAAIPSVPFLEAMLLMRRAGPVNWGVTDLARGLYLSDKVAAGLLDQLHGAGVIVLESTPPHSYRYAPSAELAANIDQLAEVYADNLIGVSNLIHSSTGKKIPHGDKNRRRTPPH